MKTRFLIIIGMIVLIIISVTLTELSHQMDLCEMSSSFYDHLPEMNMLECLQFLSSTDYDKPSMIFDFTYSHLSLLETIVIVGVGSSLIIFLTWRKRK